jgi:hypothetical protein
MKFWFIRLSASFFVIGAFGIGCLIAYEYGLFYGLTTSIASTAMGIFLHKLSERVRNRVKEVDVR